MQTMRIVGLLVLVLVLVARVLDCWSFVRVQRNIWVTYRFCVRSQCRRIGRLLVAILHGHRARLERKTQRRNHECR